MLPQAFESDFARNKKHMKITLKEIATLISGDLEQGEELAVQQIASLSEATGAAISFLSNPKYESQLYTTQAAAVIVQRDFVPKTALSTVLIKVEDPYLAITTLQSFYERMLLQSKTGIEQPSFIADTAHVGKDCYIGAFAYIGENVSIGDHVKIYPHTYIGDNTKIGNHTIIYPGVKIYHNSHIGTYCNIQAGAVIGSHGFGFAPQPDGSYKNIPQLGNVILGDHVDIGANTTIDCATFGSTRIETGVKIDNQVQIAHNVGIGENTVIAAQTGISGSTTIGKQVMIGGQTGTVGHIHIADFTKVGARAGITKNTKSSEILWGVPAMDKTAYLKSYAIYKKLPELMKRIEELEQKLLNLNSTNHPE